MMTLSWFHDPPRGLAVSARTVTGPPAAGTFFKWPSAKKATNFPSADQKGKEAPSVPSSFLAARSLRNCTQIESRSFWLRAQNATAVPSGVIAGGPEKSPVKSKPTSAGGGKYDRTVRAGACSRRFDQTFVQTTAASSTTATAAHSRRSRKRRRRLTGGAWLMPEPLLAIQRNSRATSAAFCQRDSGSFARQSWTT